MTTERLVTLFGDHVADALDDFDLDEELGRMELVERFAPLPPDAAGREGRMALRTVVVNQVLDDDPPEAWETVRRLMASGMSTDNVLSEMSMAAGEVIKTAVSANARFDTDAYVDALDRLPLPTASDIAQKLIDVVRQQPGVEAGAHFDRVLATFGPDPAPQVESMVDRVLDDMANGPLHWLPHDHTVLVPDLADGAVFTRRLTDAELELGVLTAGFDLGAFSRFDIVHLDDGTELEPFSVDVFHLGWAGPDGWLSAFDPGDLLACRATVAPSDDPLGPLRATVTIEVVEEPPIDDELVGVVRAAYDETVAEPGLPVDGGSLAWWVLFHHPGSFDEPALPLSELCAASGLELRGSVVAHDESIWRNSLIHRRMHQVFDQVPEHEWQVVLGRAVEVLDDPDASVDEVRASLAECAESETIDVLADIFFPHYLDPADEFDRGGAEAPGRLFELVERATAIARRPREVATAEYLAAVLHERCGEPEMAEQHLKRAADAQPGLGPVVERLGWYRFDRGDAQGATRWWRKLGQAHPSTATIEPFLGPDARGSKLGRNDPCWCGSGRKFKRCHQGSSELPALPDRVGWLCHKAALWLEHTVGEPRTNVMDLALAWAAGTDDPTEWDVDDADLVARMADAFEDPIVFDAALHEGGLFSLFLRERGQLLPDDEQLLAASWQTVDRSVHEVVGVEPGTGLTMRNLGTGDVIEVRERTLSTEAGVGDRFCARIVPDGASNQIIGGLFPVRTGQEAAVLDMCAQCDPLTLCAWAGSRSQPQRIVQRPGMAEEMFDREAIESLLADLGDDVDPNEAMAVLQSEINRQAMMTWLDESIPALGGVTPREAAADPTRRDQLERLLEEFDRDDRLDALPEGFTPVSYDVAALRRELGLH